MGPPATVGWLTGGVLEQAARPSKAVSKNANNINRAISTLMVRKFLQLLWQFGLPKQGLCNGLDLPLVRAQPCLETGNG